MASLATPHPTKRRFIGKALLDAASSSSKTPSIFCPVFFVWKSQVPGHHPWDFLENKEWWVLYLHCFGWSEESPETLRTRGDIYSDPIGVPLMDGSWDVIWSKPKTRFKQNPLEGAGLCVYNTWISLFFWCWMDDDGCRKTPSLRVQTAFGRCWYLDSWTNIWHM